MFKPFIKLCLVIFSSVLTHTAFADIYEYIDEAGVAHYSDVPNNGIDGHDNYVLILKSELPATVSTNSNSTDTNHTTDNTLTAASASDTLNPTLGDTLNNTTATLTPSQLLAQIEQSALNHQVESELIHAVMHVESAYKVKAKSHKGAQGLMQLMPATANRLGVKNSYDPAQNIEGGAKYLRELLTLFNNDITLTIAAYNAGENAVIRYGNRIPPYKETQAYVPKVLNIYWALMKQRGRGKQAKQAI